MATMVTLTGTFTDSNGTPETGRILFSLASTATDGETIFTDSAVGVRLDEDGAFTIDLEATDDLTVTGNLYRVEERLNGHRNRIYWIELPSDTDPANLADLATWDEPPNVVYSPTLAQSGWQAGLGTHEADTGAHDIDDTLEAWEAEANTTFGKRRTGAWVVMDADGNIELPLSHGTVQTVPPTTDVVSYYVDATGGGSDSNNGLTTGAPLATVASAYSRLSVHAATRAAVYIKSTEAAPVREFIVWNITKDVWVLPWPGEARFYIYGSKKITSGWTDDGGGVYHQAVTGTPLATWVTTLFDTVGRQTTLTKNTSTPTTPGTGEWGISGGNLYVKLAGSADPGVHTIEWAQAAIGWNTYNTGTLTMIRPVIRYCQTYGLLVGGQAGTAEGAAHVVDGVAEYFHNTSGAAWGLSRLATEMFLVTCTGRYHLGNDGFNFAPDTGIEGTAVLVDCEAAWNSDEGCSAHEDSSMYVFGGFWHHNGNSGQASVHRAFVGMYGTLLERNHRLSVPTDEAAVSFFDDTTGELNGVICRDNYGPGISTADTTGDVTMDGCLSYNNVGADNVPSGASIVPTRVDFTPDPSNNATVITGPMTPLASVGTWSANQGAFFFGYRITNTGTQNDYVEWEVSLAQGCWNLDFFHDVGTNRGIYTVSLDGVTVGSVDGYAGSGANAKTTVPVQVTRRGTQKLRVTLATKNASSSSYVGAIHGLGLSRAS